MICARDMRSCQIACEQACMVQKTAGNSNFKLPRIASLNKEKKNNIKKTSLRVSVGGYTSTSLEGKQARDDEEIRRDLFPLSSTHLHNPRLSFACPKRLSRCVSSFTLDLGNGLASWLSWQRERRTRIVSSILP